MQLSWTDFKSFVDARGLSIQWIDANGNYYLKAFDGVFSVDCLLVKALNLDEVTEFEGSYKAAGNKPLIQTTSVQSMPFLGSKSIVIAGVNKKLFSRFTGVQSQLLPGANKITYAGVYPWSKIVGVEVMNGESLDTASFKVFDSPEGAFSGVPNLLLNQFAFSVNIAKDYYIRMAQFDADFYAGMVISIDYNSVSAKMVGINILQNEVK